MTRSPGSPRGDAAARAAVPSVDTVGSVPASSICCRRPRQGRRHRRPRLLPASCRRWRACPIRLRRARVRLHLAGRGTRLRAYSHVDMVARRGEFATRGILDIFRRPPTSPSASVLGRRGHRDRQFSAADQRTVGGRGRRGRHYPARELPITDAVATRAATRRGTEQRHPRRAAQQDRRPHPGGRYGGTDPGARR